LAEENKVTLNITGMTCAACAARLAKGLSRMPGMRQANVNLAAEKATLVYDSGELNLEQILNKIKDIGYEGLPADLTKVDLAIGGMT
jgi:Cu+-exporting ATPase